MGVEVAQDDSIAVGEVEQSIEVRLVSWRAGGRRREVDVEDVESRVTKLKTNTENLQDWIINEKVIAVDRNKLDVVPNEDGETTPATTRTIAAKESVIWKRRVSRKRSQLRLLQTCNLDVVIPEEDAKFILGRTNSVNIKLKESWDRRRRRKIIRTTLTRTRIRSDAGSDEEESY